MVNFKKQIKMEKEIVNKIIDELCSRGGFDGWWGSIDEDIQEDIKNSLEDIIISNQNSIKEGKYHPELPVTSILFSCCQDFQ